MRVLFDLRWISLFLADDLVEDEVNKLKLKMLKEEEGLLRDLIKNMISFSSYKYISGSKWKVINQDL